MSVILVKRPSNQPSNHYVDDAYNTLIFEWKSSDGLEGRVPAYVMDYRQNPDKSYPFTTIMSFVVEAGFNYYLYKLWVQTEVSGGGTIYVNTPAIPGLALQNTPGVVKSKLRMSVDDERGLSPDIPTVAELLTRMNTNHFEIDVSSTLININTNLAELKGPTGKGWTDASYNSTNGILTFNFSDGLGFNTSDIRGGKGDKGDKGDDGDNGTNGKGWTGATYSATTGKVSFASNDGSAYVFDTGDLRGGAGANGKGWTGTTYVAGTGIVTFASNDGFGFSTGDLRGGSGANGKGGTGATYVAGTGIVTFASNDGFGFSTGDLRGGSGANGKGWTGATYNSTTGKVSFTSNDVGFAFDTGDLRGTSGATLTTTQLSALMNTTDHFTLNGTTNKIDFKTTYKIPTTGTADTLATTRAIAGVDFNGSTGISIPYFNLTNKIGVGNGLSITTGSVTVSPVITPNFSAGTGITINTGVNPITIGVSGLTATLIPDLDTAKITTGTFVDTRIPTLAISKISGLQGALDAKQATINNTANQIIIGNGNGLTTTNAGLT